MRGRSNSFSVTMNQGSKMAPYPTKLGKCVASPAIVKYEQLRDY